MALFFHLLPGICRRFGERSAEAEEGLVLIPGIEADRPVFLKALPHAQFALFPVLLFAQIGPDLTDHSWSPKDDIDKNTYTVFDLERGVPTFAYELDKAVEEGYLVNYNTLEYKTKILEQGIHYSDLSDEEKEKYELATLLIQNVFYRILIGFGDQSNLFSIRLVTICDQVIVLFQLFDCAIRII